MLDITGGRPGGAGYKGQRPNMRPEAQGPDKPQALFFVDLYLSEEMARKMTFRELPVKTILYKTFGVIFNNERVITVFCKQPVYKHLYGSALFYYETINTTN